MCGHVYNNELSEFMVSINLSQHWFHYIFYCFLLYFFHHGSMQALEAERSAKRKNCLMGSVAGHPLTIAARSKVVIDMVRLSVY